MKKTFAGSVSIAVISVLVLCASSFAAEFSADVVITGQNMTVKTKLYVKGKNVRQEMSQQGMNQAQIMRMDKKVMWMLMPDQKMYMEMPLTSNNEKLPGTEENIDTKADKKELGRETVNGYDCKKTQYIFHDKSQGTMTQWISEKLDFPVKAEMDGPNGRTTIDYKNIKEEKLADSLFEVPSGYQKMAMPAMPGGMTPPK